MTSNKTIVTMICISLISLVAVGCSDSGSSNSLTAAAVDTAPPAVPANLNVNFSDASGAATIYWSANTTDADLAGYIVSRDYYGSADVLVASPAMITDFEDASPLMGTSTYYVSAVDDSGNESAVASVELTRSGEHRPRTPEQSF